MDKWDRTSSKNQNILYSPVERLRSFYYFNLNFSGLVAAKIFKNNTCTLYQSVDLGGSLQKKKQKKLAMKVPKSTVIFIILHSLHDRTQED